MYTRYGRKSCTESMTDGYGPTFSPRYFSYLHQPERNIDINFSYNNFITCEENCVFCSDRKVLRLKLILEHSLEVVEDKMHNVALKHI